jgi:crossover junction endodeoxyribonuclease RuvC
MPSNIIIGIDPGIADAGYGVISSDGGRDKCLAYGSIRTAAGLPAAVRLKKLHDELRALIERYRPRQAAIEKLFFSKNVKTALQVAEARGVIRLCFEEAGLPCREFGPAEVKIAVSGHGGAAKQQMQKMVQVLLRLPTMPESDDAADALALALAMAHTNKFDQ